MKAFKFRLESLLQLREISKDRALSKYAQAINFRQDKEKELQASELHLQELQFQISENRKISFTGSKQEAFDLSIKQAKEQIIDANKNLQQSLQAEEAKKGIYLKSNSEYKSLLRLKEKQFEIHVSCQSELETVRPIAHSSR